MLKVLGFEMQQNPLVGLLKLKAGLHPSPRFSRSWMRPLFCIWSQCPDDADARKPTLRTEALALYQVFTSTRGEGAR